jgi:hypothetical protein
MSYEKIRRFEEKEDIFENSEFTCFCKFLRSGLHAKFDVLAIIHVILLNIPDNYDKILSIRRRSIGLHKFKIQKMHVLCQHI